jgi:hypothetical protein
MEVGNQSTVRSGEMRRSSNNKAGKKMRDRLKAYFNNEDAVPWQYEATFGTSRD